MDAKKKRLMTVLLVAGFVFVGLVMVNGCKKEEPTPTATQSGHDHDGHDHEHGEDGHTHEHSEMAMTTETAKEIASAEEQTTCPVMEGKPINKAIFTEYKGKKVYFCCPPCEAKFKADPEKYIAKLPQFN
ncbi:MAG: YHS domain-containing protein [Planctomycetota bacterium]|nr:YHS domain-containing protein [Planctomycetota bacterium]